MKQIVGAVCKLAISEKPDALAEFQVLLAAELDVWWPRVFFCLYLMLF